MPIENFEQCLSRIMKERNTNYSELSRVLNYSSKNTLHRILMGESGDKSRAKVFNDISNNKNLKFNDSDIEDLEQALEVSKVGLDRYEAIAEMRDLMLKKQTEPKAIFLNDIQNMREISLLDLTNTLIGNNNEIIIINCCWDRVSLCMKKLLEASRDSNICQYLIITEKTADTVRKVGNALPIISYPNYSGYSIRKSSAPNDITDEFSHNMIIIRSKEKNGRVQNHQIIMNNDHSGFILKGSFDLYEYWKNRAQNISEYLTPIKTDYTQNDTAEAYLQFTDLYCKLESNSAIYTYKPDLSFNFINVEITKSAFLDGLKQIESSNLASEKIIKRLEEVHTKRFNNIFTKKKVTQHVCSAKGLEDFAQTGILSDHFYVMRPYTVKERIEIFKHLLDHIENNPHFNIHLLKYDDIFVNMEAYCFEDIGVHFTSMTTRYKLEEDHTEAVVRQKDFIELYIELFTGVLLKKYVKTHAETVQFFKTIISNLESSL